MLYQICIMGKDTEGNSAAKATRQLNASDLSSAYALALADTANANADLRIYPFCTLADGEGQIELAKATLASFEKWERRNNFACMNPVKRSAWDREDYTQDAIIAIIQTLVNNPSATMYECKSNAFTYISTIQKRHERKSECEYLPGWGACNITPKMAKATFPALDRLMKKAVESADLTEAQMEALNAIADGYNVSEYAKGKAEKEGRKVETVRTLMYRTVRAAYHKILLRMVELDTEGAFNKAGFTADDIDMKLAELAKGKKH